MRAILPVIHLLANNENSRLKIRMPLRDCCAVELDVVFLSKHLILGVAI